MEKMVNFSENFDVKFLKKSKSCRKAQQNTLLLETRFLDWKQDFYIGSRIFGLET